jgi:hypothetical protein
LCFATDETPTSSTTPEPTSSAQASVDAGVWLHGHLPRRQFSVAERERMPREENVCLMLRTYIVVREGSDSDVTHRDGEVICQPAWKFQTRSAVITVDDR